MNKSENSSGISHTAGCSCCSGHHEISRNEMTRRDFVKVAGTGALGTVALSGLSWTALASSGPSAANARDRKPLVVKPVFTYEIPVRREQTSWRSWGGIQTEKDVADETARIRSELEALTKIADFPVRFLPVSGVCRTQDLGSITDLNEADLFLIYAAGGGMDIFSELNKMEKNIIFFCRYKSGPVYLWYEIVSPRFLRQHSDTLAVKGITENDVVIDRQDELLWRLRALAGLKNTLNSRILAVGGPGAWSQPLETAMKLVKDTYKLDIQTISYEELGKLITEARKDRSVVSAARANASNYLDDTGVSLETKRSYVENCFILEDILSRLMDLNNCRAVTINNCMGTIMPLAETSACLTLSLLNDAGYLAFCESDFVVVPSGLLLGNIAGRPVFLNDPTYPHDNTITLAHCTAPRRMDGKRLEPVRLLTHFESDYGAAPKVQMLVGQSVTNILPDFSFTKNIGLAGKIIDNPFLDICRSQIDISYNCNSRLVAEKMPGFHWITVYGDYLREAEYALKKIGIELEILG